MSIESKEIKDLHEIYQNLQEGPMSGAIITSKEDNKKDKPIIIRLKNGGKKTIYPNHPDYKAYKNNERNFSGSGESRIKINPDGRSGSSDVSSKEDLSGMSTDKDKEDAKKEADTAKLMVDSGKYKKVVKNGGEVLQKVKDPKPEDNKIDPPKTKVEKPYKSPANIKTNQNQSREFAKNDPRVKLNQFSRTSTYTADDKAGTQVQRSTVFTKHYKTGKELGVMTRNQRRAYDLEAAKFKANQANQNNSTPIKTDSSSSSSTTFDSNKVKDGNKGVTKTITKKKFNPSNTVTKIDHNNEAYDAYDLVLNYLLETSQVDTIEEANYVMTQMDESTIQGIVNEYA